MDNVPDFLKRPWFLGILLGLFYGASARLVFFNNLLPEMMQSFFIITTMGFVFFVPFVMGYLSVKHHHLRGSLPSHNQAQDHVFDQQAYDQQIYDQTQHQVYDQEAYEQSQYQAYDRRTDEDSDQEGFEQQSYGQTQGQGYDEQIYDQSEQQGSYESQQQARDQQVDSETKRWVRAIFLPWLSTGLMLLASMLFTIEAVVCVMMATPVFLGMSSVGGVVAEIMKHQKGNHQKIVLLLILGLPYGSSLLEAKIPLPMALETVKNEIVIEASEEVVWKNIAQVSLIEENEHQSNLFHTLGFPRPLEATLSKEGIGGVRHASFEDNVIFIETVTQWEHLKSIGFTIEAQLEKSESDFLTDKILGGKYFDVLSGLYRLERLGPQRVRLHLSSQHRVATHYNFYAGFWTRWVMSDLQAYILRVIKRRCETQSFGL